AAAFLKNQGATNIQILSGAKPEEKFVKGTLPGDSSPSFITVFRHALSPSKCHLPPFRSV
ncbi:MAG: hypothetical protein ABSG51_08525, partial [Terracidiphilus sp.]